MYKATCEPTCWALADKAADLVQTFALVQTGRAEALVHLDLTVNSLKSWTNDANKVYDFKFSQKLQKQRIWPTDDY